MYSSTKFPDFPESPDLPESRVFRESTFEQISRWFSLLGLAPLLLILALPVAIHIAQKPDLGLEVHRLHVVTLVKDGPAQLAGLEVGDRIVEVNGQGVDSWASWYAATAGHFDLLPQSISVQRGPETISVWVTPVRPAQSHLIRDYSLWVVGLAFLLIGWWIFTRRRDPVARNFFSLCFIFAFFLLDIPDLPSVLYMTAKEHIRDLLQLLLPAFFLRFFLQFPSRKNPAIRSIHYYRLLLVPGLTLFAFSVGVVYLHPAPMGSQAQLVLELASLVYMLLFFVASLVTFARRVLRRDRPIQRTKMVVIFLGLVLGLLPFLSVTILGNLNPEAVGPHVQYLAFSLLLVPTSFALAIMRYGALDKAFVVRISLIYGFLTVFMLVTYLLVVIGVGYFLGRVFQVNSYPVLVLIIASLSLAILPMRGVIQNWIDRAFYPSRLANRAAISELARSLGGHIETHEVVQTMLRRLQELYQPQSLALFSQPSAKEGSYRPVGVLGLPREDLENLASDSALAVILDRHRRPLFAEELEEFLFTGESDPGSLQTMTRLKVSLLVPLITGNRLQGFWAFGPKNNGALYSQEDLTNLQTLAMQSAPVMESRQFYQENLNQKRLETELEVARELQGKLLPQEALIDPCYVITGKNEPCRMVGGDYFDYFQRHDQTLGLAIADVAGKGIPAALQMTSLQFAFRQVADRSDSPRQVITKLNSAVTSLVSGGGFVCFFFGIWDPDSGLLTYCNAGMEPPVLFRPGARFRQELKKGGPVLGVDPDFNYAEGVVALKPGDRLFLYTDGLTDERNRLQEFFDTHRLLQLVSENINSSPPQLIGTIFSTVNNFGGEEKDDDKTAILLEIKKLRQKKAFRSSSC